jgi:hypothetical protein
MSEEIRTQIRLRNALRALEAIRDAGPNATREDLKGHAAQALMDDRRRSGGSVRVPS